MVLRKGGTPQCARCWLNPCLSVSACGNCPGPITGHAGSCKLVLHEEPRTQMLQSMPPPPAARLQHPALVCLHAACPCPPPPFPPSLQLVPRCCPCLPTCSLFPVPTVYSLPAQRPGQLQLVPSPSPLWPTAAWSLSLPCIPYLQLVPSSSCIAVNLLDLRTDRHRGQRTTCAGKHPTTKYKQAAIAVTSAIGTHAVSHSL